MIIQRLKDRFSLIKLSIYKIRWAIEKSQCKKTESHNFINTLPIHPKFACTKCGYTRRK